MLKIRKRISSIAAHGSSKIRMQPNYHSEISDDYVEAMQKQVDSEKPANFRLTAISEAGW